jgi:hypothetical protein
MDGTSSFFHHPVRTLHRLHVAIRSIPSNERVCAPDPALNRNQDIEPIDL